MKNYLSNESLREPCLRNLILAPMLGGLFLMFLPAIGFYLVGKAILSHLAARVNRPLPMAAGSAYLTGQPTDGTLPESSLNKKLDEIASEIEKTRNRLDR